MTTVQDVPAQKGPKVHAIGAESSVLDAARAMNDHRIGSLMVIDTSGTPVGIITERDILTRVVAALTVPGPTGCWDFSRPSSCEPLIP